MIILRRIFKIIAIILFWIIALVLHAWSAGVIYYCSFLSRPAFRLPLVVFYGLTVIIWLILCRKKSRGLAISLLAFLAVILWFNTIKPPPDVVFPPELAMASVDFKGDVITIHNVRNCRYRTKDDFDVVYETRTYNLDELQTLDVLVNYWGMELIAHTFLSFGFSGGKYLTVSVEIRPEIGKAYDMLQGFFKQYQLIYIWGDERDLVRLRTNYKKEDIYLYRAVFSPEEVRRLLVSMLKTTDEMNEKPQFYSTLTHSCTNTLGSHMVKAKIMRLPIWKRRLLTGTIDRRLYNEGILVADGDVPFPELRKRSYINSRAQQADQTSDFSAKIRTHLTTK